jgi:hypothetical protein
MRPGLTPETAGPCVDAPTPSWYHLGNPSSSREGSTTMKKALASVLSALMLLTLGAGTVTATGNPNTSLSVCMNAADDYYGGIKVYAKDKAKGPSRVMCPHTYEQVCEPPTCGPEDFGVAATARSGSLFDRNLNGRNRNLPLLEDIWHGFDRNIESFKLRAAAGCVTGVFLQHPRHSLLLRKYLDNRAGTAPKTKFYEISRRKDNKATKVALFVTCVGDDPEA